MSKDKKQTQTEIEELRNKLEMLEQLATVSNQKSAPRRQNSLGVTTQELEIQNKKNMKKKHTVSEGIATVPFEQTPDFLKQREELMAEKREVWVVFVVIVLCMFTHKM